MTILQLIDTLEAGGAEKIAVSYANALAETGILSALVATRAEGPLKQQLDSKVRYHFLHKKKALDLKAVFSLRSFVKRNQITIVHAHGTSFFTAAILKICYPSIKIIWHEHFGGRAGQDLKSNLPLWACSFLFSEIFVVNHQLENWVKKTLGYKNVAFLPNFAVFENLTETTELQGESGKRIVLLANLKHPKNHLKVLEAFFNSALSESGWSLHFVGKDFEDDYSKNLKEFAAYNNLDALYFYNGKSDIRNILSQASIGLLASTSEGFPVTILEYGLAKLPVISTNVGFCGAIISDGKNGLLFDPADGGELCKKMVRLANDAMHRKSFGLLLYKTVNERFSKEIVIDQLISKYKQL